MSSKTYTKTEKADKIKSSVDQLEKQRAAGLKTSFSYQKTKAKAQERERARLVKKYGPHHPKVANIDRQLTQNPKLFVAYDEEITRADQPTPVAKESTWTVLGTIRSPKRESVADLTLSLFNDQGEWAEDLGYTCSDAKGRFSMEIEDPTGALTQKYAKAPLYLRITDDDRKILWTDSQSTRFSLGQTVRREIVLERKSGTPPTAPSGNIPTKPRYSVEGVVTDANGMPMDKVTVRAVDIDGKKEQQLGDETLTDAKGYYRIAYKEEDFSPAGREKHGADIVIKLIDQAGIEFHKTPQLKDAPEQATIDVMVS